MEERWRDSEGEKLFPFCCNTHQTFGGGGGGVASRRPVPLHHGQVPSGTPTGCQLLHGQKWRGALYSPPCIALISSFFFVLVEEEATCFLFAVMFFYFAYATFSRNLERIFTTPWPSHVTCLESTCNHLNKILFPMKGILPVVNCVSSICMGTLLLTNEVFWVSSNVLIAKQ